MPQYFFSIHHLSAFTPDKLNKVNLYESPRMFCDVYCLLPGQEQKPHDHAANDKVYFAMTGTCRATIGDETRDLNPGEAAVAPAGVVHGVRNDSDSPATLLVFMAPHPRLKA